MSKKYRQINKYEVLNLFYHNEFLTRSEVIKHLNTSRYKVIIALEDLLDDGLLKHVSLPGIHYNLPINCYTLVNKTQQI